MSARRLTALIPAHNDDHALAFCLRSIVDHFDEIIVLDDCSSDNTPDVALDIARRRRHVRLLRHEGNQLGWVRARNRLLAHTDSDWLFWLDSDDVLCEYNAHLLREIAEGPHAVVRLQLCEMWGDFNHTTQRLRHYDRCHVFVNRRLDRDFFWRGRSMARPATARAAARSPGPLFFHVKGVKPDRRLVERHFARAWLRAGAPGRLEDFAGLVHMSEEEVHRRALHVLFHSRQDRPRRLSADGPPLPDVLQRHRRERTRFHLIYRDGQPVDRVDLWRSRLSPGDRDDR